MLHHVEIYVSNLEISRAFWLTLLANIGYSESGYWGEGFTLENGEGPYLTFIQVSDKHALHEYHRCGVGLNHLAFQVESRDVVDEIRQHCLTTSTMILYDDRYPFANSGTDYYALFIEDPDRIKVEFLAK